MKKVKLYTPKPLTNELLGKIMKDRAGKVGRIETPDRMPADPHLHVEVTFECKYCMVPFFFRAEAVCPACGSCQSCGFYHENHRDTECMCGNHIEEGSPEVIVRRVRRMQ